MKKPSQKSEAPHALYAVSPRTRATLEALVQVDTMPPTISLPSAGSTTHSNTNSGGDGSSHSTGSWESIWQKRAGRSKQTENSPEPRGTCWQCKKVMYDEDIYYRTHRGELICWDCSPDFPMD